MPPEGTKQLPARALFLLWRDTSRSYLRRHYLELMCHMAFFVSVSSHLGTGEKRWTGDGVPGRGIYFSRNLHSFFWFVYVETNYKVHFDHFLVFKMLKIQHIYPQCQRSLYLGVNGYLGAVIITQDGESWHPVTGWQLIPGQCRGDVMMSTLIEKRRVWGSLSEGSSSWQWIYGQFLMNGYLALALSKSFYKCSWKTMWQSAQFRTKLDNFGNLPCSL